MLKKQVNEAQFSADTKLRLEQETFQAKQEIEKVFKIFLERDALARQNATNDLATFINFTNKKYKEEQDKLDIQAEENIRLKEEKQSLLDEIKEMGIDKNELVEKENILNKREQEYYTNLATLKIKTQKLVEMKKELEAEKEQLKLLEINSVATVLNKL